MLKKIDYLKSIQGLNDADLKARIEEDEMRLKKLKFAHAISPVENPMSKKLHRPTPSQPTKTEFGPGSATRVISMPGR